MNKKVAPPNKKWLSSVIMAINKENVNGSCVFVNVCKC